MSLTPKFPINDSGITLREYFIAVAKELTNVRVPPDTDKIEVAEYLKDCWAFDVKVDKAAEGLLAKFGHNDTVN